MLQSPHVPSQQITKEIQLYLYVQLDWQVHLQEKKKKKWVMFFSFKGNTGLVTSQVSWKQSKSCRPAPDTSASKRRQGLCPSGTTISPATALTSTTGCFQPTWEVHPGLSSGHYSSCLASVLQGQKKSLEKATRMLWNSFYPRKK